MNFQPKRAIPYICIKNRGLDPEEGTDDGGDDDEEDTGAKPGGGDFAGVGVAGVPFTVNFYCADQAEDGADGVHQVCSGNKVRADLGIGFIDTGVAVLGFRVKSQKCQSTQQK